MTRCGDVIGIRVAIGPPLGGFRRIVLHPRSESTLYHRLQRTGVYSSLTATRCTSHAPSPIMTDTAGTEGARPGRD